LIRQLDLDFGSAGVDLTLFTSAFPDLTAIMKTKLALSILPTELLDRVAQHSDFLDRLALCLTSQLFYAVSLRQIYHCVVLKDAARIVQCCRAILSNKEAAHAVRQFMMLVF
jgi:hypothetical protein